MSRRSSAIHSPGRRPVAAANITRAPLHVSSLEATAASCVQDSNGRFSVRRRCGLSTPCLAGLTSIIPPETPITKLCDGFREQPAQLRDRLGLRVMLRQVLVDEPSERQRGCGAVRAPQALKRPLECLPRIPLGLKTAPLHPPRAAPANPIAVTPERLSASRLRLHPYDLTQLHHHDHSLPSSHESAIVVQCQRHAGTFGQPLKL